MAVLLIALMGGVGAYAEVMNPTKALQEQIKAFNAQNQEYMQEKGSKLKNIQEQLRPLQAELQGAKDEAVREKLRVQLTPLMNESAQLSEEISLHEIETLKKRVDFDQQLLKDAQERLAKLKTNKTASQNKMKDHPDKSKKK